MRRPDVRADFPNRVCWTKFHAASLRNGVGAATFFFFEEDVAMDRLTKRDQPDRSKINMHEAWEVKYWTHALGVSREKLQQAVDKVGNSAAAVRKELAV